MPTAIELETVKQQVNSFQALGCTIDMGKVTEVNPDPKITIGRGNKIWKFSDPDWSVIIMQLAQLYKIMRKK